MADEAIGAAGAPSTEPPGIPYARGRDRNTPWIVFGVLLATLGGLGAFLVATNLADRVDVVVAARDINAGEPLAADDLMTVSIAGGDGAQAIAGNRIPEFVGAVSRSDLAAGAILHPDQLVDAGELVERTVIVGAELTPGQYPLPTLAAGQVVQMVEVTGEASFDDAGGGGAVLGEATIVAARVLNNPDNLIVSFRMVESLAPLTSERAQQGRLRLVVIDDAEDPFDTGAFDRLDESEGADDEADEDTDGASTGGTDDAGPSTTTTSTTSEPTAPTTEDAAP